MTPPLLLTSSVIPVDLSGNLNDPSVRMMHTIESISEWLKIDPHIEIVICDGSGFDFSDAVQINFPSANIECIFINNDAEKILAEIKETIRKQINRHMFKQDTVQESNIIVENNISSESKSDVASEEVPDSWEDNM
jgi:hypothetical protein